MLKRQRANKPLEPSATFLPGPKVCEYSVSFVQHTLVRRPSEPMIRRIDVLDPRIPVYFLHGEKSWIDSEPSVLIASKRDDVFVDMIEEAGHHVYADAPEEFNLYLKRILMNKE